MEQSCYNKEKTAVTQSHVQQDKLNNKGTKKEAIIFYWIIVV